MQVGSVEEVEVKCVFHAVDNPNCSWSHRGDWKLRQALAFWGKQFSICLLKGSSAIRKGTVSRRVLCLQDCPFVSVRLCYLQFKSLFLRTSLRESYIYLYSNIKKLPSLCNCRKRIGQRYFYTKFQAFPL